MWRAGGRLRASGEPWLGALPAHRLAPSGQHPPTPTWLRTRPLGTAPPSRSTGQRGSPSWQRRVAEAAGNTGCAGAPCGPSPWTPSSLPTCQPRSRVKGVGPGEPGGSPRRRPCPTWPCPVPPSPCHLGASRPTAPPLPGSGRQRWPHLGDRQAQRSQAAGVSSPVRGATCAPHRSCTLLGDFDSEHPNRCAPVGPHSPGTGTRGWAGRRVRGVPGQRALSRSRAGRSGDAATCRARWRLLASNPGSRLFDAIGGCAVGRTPLVRSVRPVGLGCGASGPMLNLRRGTSPVRQQREMKRMENSPQLRPAQ